MQNSVLQMLPYSSPQAGILRSLADYLSVVAPNVEYKAEQVPYDAGHNKFWTTIMARDKVTGQSWSFMTPEEQYNILYGNANRYEIQVRLLQSRAMLQNAMAEAKAKVVS